MTFTHGAKLEDYMIRALKALPGNIGDVEFSVPIHIDDENDIMKVCTDSPIRIRFKVQR